MEYPLRIFHITEPQELPYCPYQRGPFGNTPSGFLSTDLECGIQLGWLQSWPLLISLRSPACTGWFHCQHVGPVSMWVLGRGAGFLWESTGRGRSLPIWVLGLWFGVSFTGSCNSSNSTKRDCYTSGAEGRWAGREVGIRLPEIFSCPEGKDMHQSKDHL